VRRRRAPPRNARSSPTIRVPTVAAACAPAPGWSRKLHRHWQRRQRRRLRAVVLLVPTPALLQLPRVQAAALPAPPRHAQRRRSSQGEQARAASTKRARARAARAEPWTTSRAPGWRRRGPHRCQRWGRLLLLLLLPPRQMRLGELPATNGSGNGHAPPSARARRAEHQRCPAPP
jgi:hypothetical protein